MFTGIVRHIGLVRQVSRQANGSLLTIDLGPLAEGLGQGDSVAVNGACLTVSALGPSQVTFDVVSETLSKTTLGTLQVGSKVNLERSLRLADELHGHIVQGHVDGTAEAKTIHKVGEHKVEFLAEPALTGLMVPKGSVCVDGVSLTLIEVSADGFSVAVIPTTLRETTLGELVSGTKVNVETDLIGKYVLKHLATLSGTQSSGISLETLNRAGFL